MNSLQMRLPDSRILDLFSGSGALGLEAISRGAASVVFVEENPKAVRMIAENAETLGVSDCTRVIGRRVEQAFAQARESGPYDFIFVDPPYDQGHEEALLLKWDWPGILAPGGLLCMESGWRKSGAYPPPSGMEITRNERYGDSMLVFYRISERNESP
jgi:16S rRNA (guanine966-N2)-methyltransferase